MKSPGAGALVVAVTFMVMAALYLSGYVFLAVHHQTPTGATPLTILQYGYHYGHKPEYRRSLVGSAAFGLLVVGGLGIAAFIPRRRGLHGDARFATSREIAAGGLLSGDGIIVGQWGRRYLTIGKQQGAIVAAPPRSGKGVGVVIPNALNFSGSLVVSDIKKENWQVTAGFRQQHGQRVYLFDPLSETGETARWNPLFYISDDPALRISDLQRIAEILYPVEGHKDGFWALSARTLFLGLALYVFETEGTPRTLGEVLRQGMAGGAKGAGFVEHWKATLKRRRSGTDTLSWQCTAAIQEVVDLPPDTAGGVRKEMTAQLSLWLNPLLDRATAGNDFDLRDLRKKPTSIYIGVSPDNLDRLRPVLNLFFQQAIGLQTRELPEHNPALKHEVLFLMDEFTALGKIPVIETAAGFLPGYNVRLLIVIQTPSQLRSVYGREGAETIMKTLAGRILFAPKDFADAQEISNDLGSTTVKVKSHSRPLWGGFDHSSTTESEHGRMLLMPQEVKELGNDKEIILYEGIRPILADKIVYWKDRNFKGRVLPPPSVKPLTGGFAQMRSEEAPESDASQVSATTLEEHTGGPTIQDIFRGGNGPMSREDIEKAAQRFLDSVIET